MESYRHPEAEHSHACESSRVFAPGLFLVGLKKVPGVRHKGATH